MKLREYLTEERIELEFTREDEEEWAKDLAQRWNRKASFSFFTDAVIIDAPTPVMKKIRKEISDMSRKLKGLYINEDYFEVAVAVGTTDQVDTEIHIFPDAKNKKQAKKQAEYQFNKDYGRGKYEIISITREKGNPGITDVSPSEYQRRRKNRKSRYDRQDEAKLKWGNPRQYEKIATTFVEKFGREAANEFVRTRPPLRGGSDLIQQQGSEWEMQREVLKAIRKFVKRLK
jgi:hypothetical protein